MPPKSPKRRIIEVLLAEYRRVLDELKASVADVKPAELARIADAKTTNEDCTSIRSVLTHVVHCGDNYNFLIRKHRGSDEARRPPRRYFDTVREYAAELDGLHAGTVETLAPLTDRHMAAYDPKRKIVTHWGQYYDVEQLLEHAIVHVMRHRRQIEGFRAGGRSRGR